MVGPWTSRTRNTLPGQPGTLVLCLDLIWRPRDTVRTEYPFNTYCGYNAEVRSGRIRWIKPDGKLVEVSLFNFQGVWHTKSEGMWCLVKASQNMVQILKRLRKQPFFEEYQPRTTNLNAHCSRLRQPGAQGYCRPGPPGGVETNDLLNAVAASQTLTWPTTPLSKDDFL